mgnify:CR=1 FL=1
MKGGNMSKEKIKDINTQIRDLEKMKKQIKLQALIEEDVKTWKKITQLKQYTLKKLQAINGCSSWTLTKLLKSMDYFEYQHPKETKKKASSKNAEWVESYLKSGGQEAKLIETAKKGRERIAKKMFNRAIRKTAKKKSTTTTKTEGKVNKTEQRAGKLL